ncbi:hypothetical protein AsFcp4_160 [Aeromonas phage AsFcp_4]|uniref:Uncharacterized protein n=1 Tax=Aeromonas phage PX29 TaxID=926067 RepID=E5DQR2_9CAUD|nr:hypothetical protein CL89_gp148 [Aeromonas phage PX29]ADQ53048.1 hypothetical protein PX29p331 [Aeromonas phage PX29]QAX98583.1 hypothetical protein ASfcp2_249 [Aeromonas phage AsFcp_2]QAX99614.1 hypothetical protein AsFcp4_160 [Aeromonas phage AsFcp_4]
MLNALLEHAAHEFEELEYTWTSSITALCKLSGLYFVVTEAYGEIGFSLCGDEWTIDSDPSSFISAIHAIRMQ